MPAPATFETFESALRDLVSRFSAGATGFLSRDYAEASVRQDFLDPFFFALGWDLKNERQLILNKREVEIESRTMIDGRKKRADYLFRIDGTDRFVCEAKKPAEVLNSDHAFQAKRYARNKVLPLALLTDFEGLCLYLRSLSNVFRGGWITCTKQYFGELPIVSLDLRKATDRIRHDRLIALVDKMLALTPKLHAATGDHERSTLQNAVTATDRQIDQLVYELYALTPEEIAFVESADNA